MSSTQEIAFAGVNLQAGDRAKWVTEAATSCESANDATPFTVVDADRRTVFTFGATPQRLQLCYKFRYAAAGDASATAYLLFPTITLSLIRVDAAAPSATAVGCSSTVNISGVGFSSVDSFLTPSCSLGSAGQGVAVVVNDSLVSCITPSPAAVGIEGLRLDFGGATAAHPDVLSSFVVYDAASITLSDIAPAGGGYSLQTTLTLTGTGFDATYGAPRCRFGGTVVLDGDEGSVVDETSLTCGKPRFPDSERTSLGAYIVTVAANGQCYSASGVEFTTYNSQLNSVAVSGAPTDSSVALALDGVGFITPGLPGAVCAFQMNASGTIITSHTALTTLSSTSASCPTPVGGATGIWSVSVLQNGLTPDPTLFGTPTFASYDLAAVVVSQLMPPGGPIGAASTVVVHGAGFAQYGIGQLVCLVGDSSMGQLVNGTLLDSGRIRCTMPVMAFPQIVDVSVSLNGGSTGTMTATKGSFTAYAEPLVSSVHPNSGSAEGGTLVVVWGSGFTALSSSEVLRASYLRCRFGSSPGAAELTSLSHNDSAVVCLTTWGEETPGGQLAMVSLNGGGAYSSSAGVTFDFQGLHPPTIVDAYFNTAATSLVIQFDAQPTNRGLVNGVVDCSALLDEATSLQLQGTSPNDALCYWYDDFTVVAQLNMFTNAAPGMTVTLKTGVIWPAQWAYPGSCDGEGSLCSNATFTVDPDDPCDQKMTAAVEACVQPSALIQAATEIPACSDMVLSLDASRSTGGGIKPMAFEWSAHPTKTDNYFLVQTALDLANGAETLTLASELNGGSTFVFLLVVTNFLGQRSTAYTVTVTRATLAVPTVTIQAAPVVGIRKSGSTTLPAKATLANCFSSASSTIDFVWTNTNATRVAGAVATNPDLSLLAFDSSVASLRDLRFSGSKMSLGVMYTLRVTGCYSVAPTVCGRAEMDVYLLDQPLEGGIKGGDRTVGQDSSFVLDSCSSKDPDEPTARCDAVGECGTLRFLWSCSPVEGIEACPAQPPPVTACAWPIAPGSLAAGNFSFTVFISDSAQSGSVPVNDSVVVTVLTATLPSVTINELSGRQPPGEKLRLSSVASMAGQPNAPITYRWSALSSVDGASLDLSSTAMTTTGNAGPNLVLRPSALRAGADYTFALTATYLGRSASASLRVKMNAAPYGGSMAMSPDAPYTALTSEITISAIQWTDDASDLPLEYSFSYVAVRCLQPNRPRDVILRCVPYMTDLFFFPQLVMRTVPARWQAASATSYVLSSPCVLC